MVGRVSFFVKFIGVISRLDMVLIEEIASSDNSVHVSVTGRGWKVERKIDTKQLPEIGEYLDWFFGQFPSAPHDAHKQMDMLDALSDYHRALVKILDVDFSKLEGAYVKTGSEIFNNIAWELIYTLDTHSEGPKNAGKLFHATGPLRVNEKIEVKSILLICSRPDLEDIPLFPLSRQLLWYTDELQLPCTIIIKYPNSKAELESILKEDDFDIVHFDIHGVRLRENKDSSNPSEQVWFKLGMSPETQFKIQSYELDSLLRNTKLCVFNSCWSDYISSNQQSQAQILGKAGRDVVAFKRPITKDFASEFFERFYSTFFSTGDLMKSFDIASVSLSSKVNPDYHLYHEKAQIDRINCTLYTTGRSYEFNSNYKGRFYGVILPIARDQEISYLNYLIDQKRVICLHGTAGIGKSMITSDLLLHWRSTRTDIFVKRILKISELGGITKSRKEHLVIADINVRTFQVKEFLEALLNFLDANAQNKIIVTSYVPIDFSQVLTKDDIFNYFLNGLNKIQFDEYLKKRHSLVYKFFKNSPALFSQRFLLFSGGNPAFIDTICESNYEAFIKKIIEPKAIFDFDEKMFTGMNQLYISDISRKISKLPAEEVTYLLHYLSFENYAIISRNRITEGSKGTESALEKIDIATRELSLNDTYITIKLNSSQGDVVIIELNPFFRLVINNLASRYVGDDSAKLKKGSGNFSWQKNTAYSEESSENSRLWLSELAWNEPLISLSYLSRVLYFDMERAGERTLIDLWTSVVQTRSYELFTQLYTQVASKINGTLDNPEIEPKLRGRMAMYSAAAAIYQKRPDYKRAMAIAYSELKLQKMRGENNFEEELHVYIPSNYKADVTTSAGFDKTKYIKDYVFKTLVRSEDLGVFDAQIDINRIESFKVEPNDFEWARTLAKAKAFLISGELKEAHELIDDLEFAVLDYSTITKVDILEISATSAIIHFGLNEFDKAMDILEANMKLSQDVSGDEFLSRAITIRSAMQSTKVGLGDLIGELLSSYHLIQNDKIIGPDTSVIGFLVSIGHIEKGKYWAGLRNYFIMFGKSKDVFGFDGYATLIASWKYLEKNRLVYHLFLILWIRFITPKSLKGKTTKYFREIFYPIAVLVCIKRPFYFVAKLFGRKLQIDRTQQMKEIRKSRDRFVLDNDVMDDPVDLVLKLFSVLPV